MQYSYSQTVPLSVDEAVERLESEFTADGFGILAHIDVARTLENALGVTREPYRIIEVCRPEGAHRVISEDIHAGLLLPCNVVVYTEDEETTIAALKPEALLSLTENERIMEVGREIEGQIIAVIDRVVEDAQ